LIARVMQSSPTTADKIQYLHFSTIANKPGEALIDQVYGEFSFRTTGICLYST